jgi:hypothetical protein
MYPLQYRVLRCILYVCVCVCVCASAVSRLLCIRVPAPRMGAPPGPQAALDCARLSGLAHTALVQVRL